MPAEWLQWLHAADIPAVERQRHPELVIEVLQCYDAATNYAHRRHKFIRVPPDQLPTVASEAVTIKGAPVQGSLTKGWWIGNYLDDKISLPKV
ncbi:unnamed protein product [Protopolystoma xenopodis]|uniref:Uncharacterized protein n=1 Tax=Protopolystoma xenopodis TaxID=117903 RepID=A0A448X3C9_9PLAT|nr:unnamed protein product [Protopolystoma xenopodis]